MNNIPLNVHRPKMRNAFWCAGFAVAAAAVFAVLILGLSLPSGTVVEKIINCTVFALTWITGALLLSGAVHCFRNIFSGPSVVLTNEKLWVQRKGEMAVADIDTEKTEILKNKVIFHDKNGNSITVKSSMIFMPVGTLAYAVKIRKEQIEK
jgi:hypothetical protein